MCIAPVYCNNVLHYKEKFINKLRDINRATNERKFVIFGPLTYHAMTALIYLSCSHTLVPPTISVAS